ncbi:MULTISPECIES: aminotransferase class I/II-fold pyridoxal phosphate-dependent enzyme [Xenorhabdus]|uniref:aminotransferase class I/II-fold pyridoxal phosphate-dependent enzyme n=1 Tax=Xenorhabdus TaxID=626 RepID=UPI000649E3D9|nr:MULTISPECIES: aminotransferase class I/II-fold pyridoxal phosphate-dependent enzyme [Xenorhabdus]KLU15223.1 hypothetical protein AAY47_12070 [Xenorhabdus griffiniae]KOP31721.1 hypothetical protein AFK69_19415 [Xenorhabdus sp. GDc328]
MSSSAFDSLRALLGSVSADPSAGIGLHLGQLEFYNNAPDVDPAALQHALQRYPRLSALEEEKRAYLSSLGIAAAEMASWLAHCEPITGSRNGLFALMLQALLESQQAGAQPLCFLLPAPGYPAYENIARYLGASTAFYASDATDLLPRLCDRIGQAPQRFCLILCNPLMPQSRSLSMAGIDTLLALTRSHHLQLIVDECYRDFAAPEAPRFPLERLRDPAFADAALTVLHSLSKRAGLPGLRSGFALSTPRTTQALRRYNQLAGIRSNNYFASLAADAWRTPQPGIYQQVQQNWQLVREILARFLPADYGQEGIFLWLPVANDECFTRQLWQSYAIKVMPGSYLSADGASGQYVRVALNQPAAVMRDCLTKIASLLAKTDALNNHTDALKEHL